MQCILNAHPPPVLLTTKLPSHAVQMLQRSNQTPTPPNQCPYQVSTLYTLRFLRYSPDKIFKLKVTTARSKVKSRSDHDVASLHPQPMSLPSINFLHPTISEIQPGQTSSCHPPTWPRACPSGHHGWKQFPTAL